MPEKVGKRTYCLSSLVPPDLSVFVRVLDLLCTVMMRLLQVNSLRNMHDALELTIVKFQDLGKRSGEDYYRPNSSLTYKKQREAE